MNFLPALTGYRDDIDLGSKWWHRLTSVAYAMAFSAATMAALWFSIDGATLTLMSMNIAEKASLLSLFSTVRDPRTNLAEMLEYLPGDVGIRRPGGRIEYVNEYHLRSSFCTVHALQAADVLAQQLNRANVTNENTPESVTSEILSGMTGDNDARCWFYGDLRKQLEGTGWGDLIAYQFSWQARTRVVVWAAAKVVAAMAVLHLVLATFYHRAVVYVICGPRKRFPAQS